MLELVAAIPEIAEYLGKNVYGEYVFMYDSMAMVCELLASGVVECLTETDKILHCELTSNGSFTNCEPYPGI